jgi:voltage-gated potassium channel
MNQQPPSTDQVDIKRERWELLEHIDHAMNKPLVALSFVWLGLLILDFTRGLSPLLQTISYAIWALFVLDFLLGIVIAPQKLQYLRRNWLTALSLMLPALRILRIFRAFRLLQAARATRSVSLIRTVTSLNRGMRAIGQTMGRRGIGYVIALTVVVTFGGAAGMYTFESPRALCEATHAEEDIENVRQFCAEEAAGAEWADVGLSSYGEAVWWTAMIMTTMGSEYWPQTVEGRILGWLLAVYAFAIFGYITATIASYFVGQDVASGQTEPVADTGNAAETTALREEVVALRQQIALLMQQLEVSDTAQTPPINE